jgi:hypothetical protein
MSVHASSWGWNQEVKNSTHRLVLIAMCDNAAGPDTECPGLCWPSQALIARRCIISERHTKNVINELVEAGLIIKHRRRRRPDGTLSVWEYVIPYTRGTPVPLDESTRGTPVTEPGEPQVPNQGNPSSPRIEPSVNHQLEPSSFAPSQVMAAEDAAFDKFWKTYQRTGPKKVAKECWTKARQKDSAENILAGLMAWVAYWNVPGASQMKWPQGWLNEERWNDVPPSVTTAAPRNATQRSQAVISQARERSQNNAVNAMYRNPTETKGIGR